MALTLRQMGAYNGNRQATFSFQLGLVHVCKLVLIAPIVLQDRVEDSLQGNKQPVNHLVRVPSRHRFAPPWR
jgi:hypothetical protein